MSHTAPASPRATVLIAHPGAELYGADRVMLESVDAFVGQGWRVVVVVPGDGPLVDEVERRGAEVRRFATPVLRRSYLRGLGPLRLGASAVRALGPGWRLLRAVRPDLVYVNTVTVPFWLALARAARVPAVCHVHEAEASSPRWVRAVLASPVLLARRVVVNSRVTERVLTSSVPRLSRRCVVVYNAVPGPAEAPPPRTELEGPVQVLYVGRLSERKGVHDLVEAIDVLDRRGVAAELHVVGAVFPGYEWFEEQLRARIAALGPGARVVMHGFDPDVWSHLARADVLVVPSRGDESFGNTAVEGALAARPVVASSRGGLVEATEVLTAGTVVAPGDPAAIATAVERIVQDWPATRRRALDDARRAAHRHAPARYRAELVAAVEPLLR